MSLRPSPWPIMGTGAARRAAAEVDPQRERSRRSRPAARSARPDLRVLEGGAEPRTSRLTPRARLISLVSMVAVVLFGVVAFHVVLSQGEFKIEHLTAKADAQQDQYERLRLQVSQLESPARITSEAQNRLGMVTPDKVTPVTPNAADMPNGSSSVTSPGATSSPNSADPGNWAQVKSQLNSSAQ